MVFDVTLEPLDGFLGVVFGVDIQKLSENLFKGLPEGLSQDVQTTK